MELNWLEDFIQLAQTRNFSRAAAARHITQSAFSRRIRALEYWLGAPLIDRSEHPIALTEVGGDFLPLAIKTVRHLYERRAAICQSNESGERTVTFAAQHSLSLGFFSNWIQSVENAIGTLDVRMITDNYYGAIQALDADGCDFLMCFTHPEIADVPESVFSNITLGDNWLIPVCAPDKKGNPLYVLPGNKKCAIPFLSYGTASFLGRATKFIIHQQQCTLYNSYENAFGEALKCMAVAGRGLVWLPECAMSEELASGKLVVAGDDSWRLKLEIRLFRTRKPISATCESLWKYVDKNNEKYS